MNNDRLLTRVWDKEKRIISYIGDDIYFYPDCERVITNYRANERLDICNWAMGKYLGVFKEKLMIKFGGDVLLLHDIEDRFIPMQCTGTTDNSINSALIYAHDIIEYDDENIGKGRGCVVWHNRYCRFNLIHIHAVKEYLETGFHGTSYMLGRDSNYMCKIIGNIHQHKELSETNK